MVGWAIVCLIISISAAVLGFGGVVVGAASTAKILSVVFIFLFLLGLIANEVRARGPRQ